MRASDTFIAPWPLLVVTSLMLSGLVGIGCKSVGTEVEPSADVTKDPSEPTAAPDSVLLALTPTEYNNTIRDLLGMPMSVAAWPDPPAIAEKLLPAEGEKAGLFGFVVPPAGPWPWTFPREAGVDRFEGMAEGQASSPYLVEELQRAATQFASYILVSPTFFTCANWGAQPLEEQKACGWTSLRRFAQRAWRRPIAEDEELRLSAFWDGNWDAGTPEEALVLTAAGILQSPRFLYRIETGSQEGATGDVVAVLGWEIASRLSYFLWDSMPDARLFEAAAKGQLITKAEVEAQARRMLKDPRARAAVVHFHHQLMGTLEVHGISPARHAYGPRFGLAPEPPLDTTGDGEWPRVLLPIRHSMEAETHLFVERTLFDGKGTLKALLSDNHGYLSQHTAPLYGEGATILAGPAVNWAFGLVSNSLGDEDSLTLYPAEFPAQERAGLLTLPSVLALGAYSVHPAPILRGKRILERLACQEFGAPPPGAEAAVPPDTSDAASTNRDRTEAATSSETCAGCHDTLNPPGFAFENYDAMGAWRDEDNGLAVDASGSLTLANGESFTFENGVDFSHQLASSLAVHDCYVLRWTRYATGLHLEAADEGVLELQRRFNVDDRVMELLVSIAGSDLFRTRRVEVTP